ncbi:hypothetical protein AAII07_48185 [Microvirga sp. 0TCS3.31]
MTRIDYVARVLEGLQPSEAARYHAMLSEAALRHGLHSDVDRDHPVIGVLAEMTLHGTKMASILEEMNAVAARCENNVRHNREILRELEAHALQFFDRMKVAEQNALDKIYEPYNAFKQNEIKQLLEGHRIRSEELDRRLTTMTRAIAEERAKMYEEVRADEMKAKQREIAAHKREALASHIITKPVGWVFVGVLITSLLWKIVG